MAVVDDRVVQLQFDNKQFESATAASMATLDKLKKSLDFSSSRKGVDDLSSSLAKMHTGPFATEIEGISGRLLAMGTVGVTALSMITSKAIETGAQLVKSLTIDPITQGFSEYETNLTAIQTILANTQAAGTNLSQVSAALNELNAYSDETIYNFAEMARNIGTFTAAGVALQPAVGAIKGIANLAALSGSNSQQASTAMYQLSQALAAGKVTLMDWNSVVNAGMGGAVFQRALAQTAEKLGTIKDGAVKLSGPMKNVTIAGLSFRESISDPKVGGWLTSDVLTKTLQQFTGDLTDAQLAAEGFSAAEIKAIQDQAKAAKLAATQVKTLPQLLEVTKEAIGSGWAETWSIVFGNFNESKKDFTNLSNIIGGVVQKMSDSRNELLNQWKALGGRTQAIEALKAAFQALMSWLKPIKDAFRDFFPPATAKDLYDMTVNIKNFFKAITLGPEQMDQLHRAFSGFFAVLDIGKQIIGGIIGVFKTLFSSAGGAGGGFLEFAARVGDALVNLDNFLKQSGAFERFFQNVATFLSVPIKLLQALGAAIGSVFEGRQAAIDATGSALGRISDRLSPLTNLFDLIQTAWQKFFDFLGTISPYLQNLVQNVGDLFAQIPVAISNSVANGNYSAMLDTINTAIFGGIALLIAKFVHGGAGLSKGGFLVAIERAFNQLTNTLQAMQTQLRAKALMEIAIAVGILVASVVALSLIPSGKLTAALAGLAVTFTELMVAMKVLDQISKSAGFIKLPIIAGSLILLATAMLILAGAVLLFSTMSWEQLSKGLSGVAVVLATLDVATKPLAKNSIGLVAASGALILLGTALIIIAGAVGIFATMSWESIAKGLTAITGALAAIAVTMNLMPGPMMIVTAAGLVLVAGAISVLSGALTVFAHLSWEQIAKGLVAVLGSLAAISVAMHTMPGPMMIVTAAGLVLVAIALNGIAGAMKIMASMSWEEIGKGLVGIAGSLLILAGGLYLMTGTLAGAAALVVAAGALMMLAPVLKVLGGMSLQQIGTALLALAGAFAVIGVAALLLTPVIPSILGLAAAIALLGVGVALIGAGILAFATAITMLIAVGSMGVVALTAIMQTVIGIIPTVMMALQLAIIAFADAIIAATPKVIEAIVVVLVGLMDAIIRLTPKIYQTLGVLLDGFLKFMIEYIPKLVDAGMKIVIGILDGISKNLPKMMDKAGDVIAAFIKGLGAQSLKIITAAGDTLITFMGGLRTWIDQHTGEIEENGRLLAGAIINGMTLGLAGKAADATKAIGGLVGSVIDRAKGLLESHSPSKVFVRIGQDVVKGFVNGVVMGKEDMINSMNAITNSIKTAKDDAAKHVADLQAKIKDLESKPMTKANKAALAKAKADLKAAQAEKAKIDAAYKTVTKEHKADIATLEKLANDYDVVSKKLDEATKQLEDAKKVRDDFAKSTTESFGTLPTLDATTSLDTYFDSIRAATEANVKFKATLEQLRGLGLDDTQYKKFLQQGVAIQPFLDSLLEAGGGTIKELNNIDMSLTQSAQSIGQSAANALYQAGVDSAQGLVDGLTSQLGAITSKMQVIGKAIADEIKKELGIRSPSKVFAEIGGQTMKGLALGMQQNTNVIDMSARRAGQIAVESMRKSLSGLSDAVTTDIEVQPTIAPVLDLTTFRKDAVQINDILGAAPLQATVSVQNAQATSSAVEATKAAVEAFTAQQTAGTTVELTQVNNSPKALSTADIYRQTKNQLSILKGALPG